MITTGLGTWNPLMFMLSLIAIVLVVYIIYSFGEKRYRKEREKTKVFFSGNSLPANNKITEIYWGFLEAMGSYYKWIKKIHNGIINDYIYWFILIITIIIGLVML